jgi:hypothetical protein
VAVRRVPLKPEGAWRDGETKMLTATYVVPKGARATDAGKTSKYAGYSVALYYDGLLQDEDARPRPLLGLVPHRTPPGGGKSSATAKLLEAPTD